VSLSCFRPFNLAAIQMLASGDGKHDSIYAIF
jgi:hypothetical protein